MVERQFRQLAAACERAGVALVGGHTEVTPSLPRPLLIGQMLGTAAKDELLIPGGAQPGDRLVLTKAIAIEGTALLARERAHELRAALGPKVVARASALLDDPGLSVVRDARVLLATGQVTALHDPTEGGLVMGIRELALAAGCGADVESTWVPVLPETRAIAGHFGLDPAGMLASGSLLAAIKPAGLETALAACRDAGIPAAAIGTVEPAAAGFGWVIEGRRMDLPMFQRDEVSRALAGSGTDAG
jgi:hydrogenase maturation factor